MKRVIIVPAELGGAALSELKQWLAISTSGEDAALVVLLAASLDACETFTGIMPLAATCEEIWPARREWQNLLARPVQAITGIKRIAADAPLQTPWLALAGDAYDVDLEADGAGRFRVTDFNAAAGSASIFSGGFTGGGEGRVAVTFVVGLAPGWGSLPDILRHGIIRYAAYLYRERDSGNASAPPAAVAALWQPWRRMRLA